MFVKLWLHAYRYKYRDINVKTPLPDWVNVKSEEKEEKKEEEKTVVSPMQEIFGTHLLKPDKELIALEDAFPKSVKLIGLYFSRINCPPCQEFTPIMKEIYTEVNEDSH